MGWKTRSFFAGFLLLPAVGVVTVANADPPKRRDRSKYTPKDYEEKFKKISGNIRKRFKSSNAEDTCDPSWRNWDADLQQSAAIIEQRKHRDKLENDGYGGIPLYLKYGEYVWKQPPVNGSKVGNCGDITAMFLWYMHYSYPEVAVNVVLTPKRAHTFAVVRIPSGEQYVVDIWKDDVYGGIRFDGKNIFDVHSGQKHKKFPDDLSSDTDWVIRPSMDTEAKKSEPNQSK